MDKVGIYKGRAVKGADGSWAQYGKRENGNHELLLNVKLEIDGGALVRTVPLYFSQAAAPYSLERLRALGWKGENLANLDGIETNEVDVEVTQEQYDGKTRNKYNIMTGAGRFTTENPQSPAMWAAEVNAAIGLSSGAPATPNGPPPKPPF